MQQFALCCRTVKFMDFDPLQWVVPNLSGGRGLPLYSVHAHQAGSHIGSAQHCFNCHE
jgi:hypothetical protein